MIAPRVMIGKVDVTEYIAVMFDALVSSSEWGSGFLDADDIEAIVIIGTLAGFDLSSTEHPHPDSMPHDIDPTFRPGDVIKLWSTKRQDAVRAWRRQLAAKAAALAADNQDGNS